MKPPGKMSGTLRVRFGINTGLVVVGKIGDDLRMRYTAAVTRSTWRCVPLLRLYYVPAVRMKVITSSKHVSVDGCILG